MVGAPDPREEELHQLTLQHSRLREELESHLTHVKSIEDRFLSARPSADLDDKVRRELKRRMVLARPWREEMHDTYRAILATTTELSRVVQKIHDLQGMIARDLRRR